MDSQFPISFPLIVSTHSNKKIIKFLDTMYGGLSIEGLDPS